MKKRLALLTMVLISVCLFAVASAESIVIHKEDALFYIEVTLPDNAKVTESVTGDQYSLTTIEYTTAGMPTIVITTAIDELYTGLSLSDLSDEEVDLIINELTVEMSQPDVETRITADGYKYIIVNETTEENDTCDTVMLVNGYFIMVDVFYDDFSELSYSDTQIGPAIVETFQFIGHTNT